jgi:hypothetical protein
MPHWDWVGGDSAITTTPLQVAIPSEEHVHDCAALFAATAVYHS